jgi:hypothetical protein
MLRVLGIADEQKIFGRNWKKELEGEQRKKVNV